jgi:hypothetical protein
VRIFPATTRRLSTALGLVGALLLASGCAAHRFTRPTGPIVPVQLSDARAIWADATKECSTVDRYNAEIRPSGRAGGSRVRGSLALAVTSTGLIGVEAKYGPQSIFDLKGTADRATLWLPLERRVVTAPAAQILNALVGLDIDPVRLLAVLTGCVAVDRELSRAVRVGQWLRLETTDNTTVFVAETPGERRVVAADFDRLSIEYGPLVGGMPSRLTIATTPGRAPVVNLTFAIKDVLRNPDLSAEAFRVVVPADAVPASVSDLRPLGPSD